MLSLPIRFVWRFYDGHFHFRFVKVCTTLDRLASQRGPEPGIPRRGVRRKLRPGELLLRGPARKVSKVALRSQIWTTKRKITSVIAASMATSPRRCLERSRLAISASLHAYRNESCTIPFESDPQERTRWRTLQDRAILYRKNPWWQGHSSRGSRA